MVHSAHGARPPGAVEHIDRVPEAGELFGQKAQGRLRTSQRLAQWTFDRVVPGGEIDERDAH